MRALVAREVGVGLEGGAAVAEAVADEGAVARVRAQVHRQLRAVLRPVRADLASAETRFGRFGPNIPTANMKRNGEMDFWGIFEDFWRHF